MKGHFCIKGHFWIRVKIKLIFKIIVKNSNKLLAKNKGLSKSETKKLIVMDKKYQQQKW